MTLKIRSTAFPCPARTSPRGLASSRSVGSKLRGVKEAIPLRSAGPRALPRALQDSPWLLRGSGAPWEVLSR